MARGKGSGRGGNRTGRRDGNVLGAAIHQRPDVVGRNRSAGSGAHHGDIVVGFHDVARSLGGGGAVHYVELEIGGVTVGARGHGDPDVVAPQAFIGGGDGQGPARGAER